MYLFFEIFPIILLIFFCFNFWRRKRIVKKVRSLCIDEKYEILNSLIEPFGYSYVPSQDIFNTHIHAWQRSFGYSALYDKAAVRFKMIFDCLPVYFNYQERTWLIEFWKGQYGLNTGCEIGVYYADRVLDEAERKTALFQCAGDADMTTQSLWLWSSRQPIAQLCARHWWLTAFRMGCFSEPASLSLHACVTFRSPIPAAAFAKGLQEAGFAKEQICVCSNTVSFTFKNTGSRFHLIGRIRRRVLQWRNRFYCRIYLWGTRPFSLSMDRLLYLYYFLPFAFRRMLRFRKHRSFKQGRTKA